MSAEIAVCCITALGGVLVALVELRKARCDTLTKARFKDVEHRLDTLEEK